MILNDVETKEYLRLKAIFNADADLDLFEKRLDYFYNTQLIPVHAREDLEHYPVVHKIPVEEMEERLKCSVELLSDIVAELRAKLKLTQNNNTI